MRGDSSPEEMRTWFGIKESDKVLERITIMNLQDEMVEIFGVDQKNRLLNFRLCSQRNSSIVALLGGMERRKHILEHTRKNPFFDNFSCHFRIILKPLKRAGALICSSGAVLLPWSPFPWTLQHI